MTPNIILIVTISTNSIIVPEMLFCHVKVTLSCSQDHQEAKAKDLWHDALVVIQWHRHGGSNTCILDDGMFCLGIATLCCGRLCQQICEVVMAAFHTAPCESHEPLLMNPDKRSIDQVNREYRFLNSSIYSRKIVSLEDDGVKLITSKYRADGVIFCQKYRPILKSDTAFYGNAVDLTAYTAEVR